MIKELKSRLSDLTERLKAIKANDIMTKEVITTTQDTLLAEIAQIMIKERISGLPVMNNKGKIVGIITAGDLFLVMDMIKSGDVYQTDIEAIYPTVKFAMSTEVVKIKKNTTLEEIIVLMKYKNAHTLPVYEKDKIVGVVGRRDVFKSFYGAMKDLFVHL
jgi:CBS domain-containing protein